MPADADAVAALHADSWRRHYRGAYRDSYLDGDVFADRASVWTDRLNHPTPGQYTVVADADGAVLGFSHTILQHHPTWGALLENLHVRYDMLGRGVGGRLMAESAAVVLRSSPVTGIYLSVLKQNVAAQAFYRARGEPVSKRGWPDLFPGAGPLPRTASPGPIPPFSPAAEGAPTRRTGSKAKSGKLTASSQGPMLRSHSWTRIG